MSPRRRTVAVTIFVAALTAACGSGQSGGQPTPAPGPVVTADQIDELVVPAEQLPGALHPDRVPAPAAGQVGKCPYAPGDTAALFAPGSLALRTVRYTGAGNVFVDQVVGVYPSNDAARAAFIALTDTVRSCQSQSLTVEPDRVTWQVLRSSQVSGTAEPYATDARVAENVVFVVDVGMLSPQVGASVADAIEGKIRSRA